MYGRSTSSLRIAAAAAAIAALSAAAALALTGATLPAPRIASGPGHPSLRRVATFRFTDARPGVRFLCAVNGTVFRRCHSPARFAHLRLGTNVFRVEARARSGATSPWAGYRWTIRSPAPALVIVAPASARYYDAPSWHASCPTGAGICGTVPASRGRTMIRVAIRRLGGGRYWDGRAYRAQRPTWRPATLLAPRAHAPRGRRAWFYGLAVPSPDGRYTVRVRFTRLRRARGRHPRWVSGLRAQSAVTFTTDTIAPAPPLITDGPQSPSNAGTALLHFSDATAPVSYRCALDGAIPAGCASPASYAGLGVATHHFSVWAVDEAGNTSTPAAFSWQQVAASSQSVPFTISSQTGGRLYPGAAAETIALTLTNPGAAAISVTQLGITLDASRLPAGCPAAGFQILQPSLPATGILVPARGSVTLSDPAAGAASIQMLDTGSNQDACQSASLALSLTGSAHS